MTYWSRLKRADINKKCTAPEAAMHRPATRAEAVRFGACGVYLLSGMLMNRIGNPAGAISAGTTRFSGMATRRPPASAT